MKLKRFDQLNEETDGGDFGSVLGRHFAGDPAFDKPTMSGFEIKGYNKAIDDILMMIVKDEIKGVKKTIPPEALIYVFDKLKK